MSNNNLSFFGVNLPQGAADNFIQSPWASQMKDSANVASPVQAPSGAGVAIAIPSGAYGVTVNTTADAIFSFDSAFTNSFLVKATNDPVRFACAKGSQLQTSLYAKVAAGAAATVYFFFDTLGPAQ